MKEWWEQAIVNNKQPVPELEGCVLLLAFPLLSYSTSLQYPACFVLIVFLNLGMYFAQKTWLQLKLDITGKRM